MAVETIKKLQPQRTMSLRGFDSRGAAAALHGASDSGFTVSGYFVTPSDFCVLTLSDIDNKYEHYYFKYLPNDDFTNMVLEFDKAGAYPRVILQGWTGISIAPARTPVAAEARTRKRVARLRPGVTTGCATPSGTSLGRPTGKGPGSPHCRRASATGRETLRRLRPAVPRRPWCSA
jgi:hypothetical protein